MLESILTNSPSAWTSKRQEESCLLDSDLNNNRSGPFEWKPHKQQGSAAGKRCAGRTPFAGLRNSICSVSTKNYTCYTFLRAAYLYSAVLSAASLLHVHKQVEHFWHYSAHSETKKTKQKPKPKPKLLTWKVLWKLYFEVLVKCVCNSLNLQWIFRPGYLLSAVQASGVALWPQKINPGKELRSLFWEGIAIPSQAMLQTERELLDTQPT